MLAFIRAVSFRRFINLHYGTSMPQGGRPPHLTASGQVGDDRIQPDYIDIAISSIVEGGYADAFRIFGFFN